MKIDVHQHLWTEPLVEALAARRELPFIIHDQGPPVLILAGERPYVLDLESESRSHRRALIESDGLDRALICLSGPLGIESLPREQAVTVIDAYHDGALALGEPFGVWGAIASDRLDPDDVDGALDRGCIGISLPAGALGSVDDCHRLDGVFGRLEARSAPLLVHPGPRSAPLLGESSSADPRWWPALTRYVAEMQAAWLAFVTTARPSHPQLRVIFSMLAGLAPLHAERLVIRGGPQACDESDPLTFYECSSYGPRAVRMMREAVGEGQVIYGSDRPVVREPGMVTDQWSSLHSGSERAVGEAPIIGVSR